MFRVPSGVVPMEEVKGLLRSLKVMEVEYEVKGVEGAAAVEVRGEGGHG